MNHASPALGIPLMGPDPSVCNFLPLYRVVSNRTNISNHWTLLTKVETSCDRILIAGGANVEAEWEQGPAV